MLYEVIREKIRGVLSPLVEKGDLPPFPDPIPLSPPPRPEQGDLATNLPFLWAKPLKKSPGRVAQDLLPYLRKIPIFQKVEQEKGFLNFFFIPTLEGEIFNSFLRWIEKGGPCNDGEGKKVLLEFVSANPTGPLHVGHGRIAAVGDTLARLFERLSYKVYREYYVNNVGRQMELLTESFYARVKEILGNPIPLPEGGYQGEYLKEMAEKFLKEYPPEKISQMEEKEVKELCGAFVEKGILQEIQEDLKKFQVSFDRYREERDLYREGKVEKVLRTLQEKGYTYEKDGSLWFQSTRFGDDKDRVLRRENGLATYFSADLAYHEEKFFRGFDLLINIWGADHHGYAPRLLAGIQALGLPHTRLEILLIQFVTLIKGGKPVSMSTRTGTFTSLREVLDEVGVDTTRFFYLMRRKETHLEFDMDLAKEQKMENPVYYVQYAHARLASIERKGTEEGIEPLPQIHPPFFTTSEDRTLLRKILLYPEVLREAVSQRAPHEIPFYLLDLAKEFHTYYNIHRIVDRKEKLLSQNRFTMAMALKWVIRDALSLMGVSAPEKM